jgi:hypothetical protein
MRKDFLTTENTEITEKKQEKSLVGPVREPPLLRALFSGIEVFSVVNAFDFASRCVAVSPW